MNTSQNNRAIINTHRTDKEDAGWQYYRDNKYLLTDSSKSGQSIAHTAYNLIQKSPVIEDSANTPEAQKILDNLERFKKIAYSVSVKTYGSHFCHTNDNLLLQKLRYTPVDYYFPKWMKHKEDFTVEAMDDKYVLLKNVNHEETPNFMYHRELLYREMFRFSDRDFAKLIRHYCKAEKARFRLLDLYHMEEELALMEQRKAYLLAGDRKRKELAAMERYRNSI